MDNIDPIRTLFEMRFETVAPHLRHLAQRFLPPYEHAFAEH